MSQISYNILEQLANRPTHIRELARKLNTNQTTIARKLKDLEEQNVVDFKTEGKNKVCFVKDSLESQEHIKIMEHIKLTKLLQKHPVFRQITLELNNNKEIPLAILFGSYAKNSETKNSDIDIYLETKSAKIKLQIEQLNSKISVKIGEFDKNSLLIKEIIKTHIIIKGVDRYYEHIHH